MNAINQMNFAGLKRNIEAVTERIEKACVKSGRTGAEVRLVAVTKTHPAEALQALIDGGITDLGENRVQEIESKAPLLKGTFSLHMIGHLQTNKAARVLPFVDWIQSIDSIRLIDKISSLADRIDRKIKALVEVNTSGEPSKSGCMPDECMALCERVCTSRVLQLRGLMTIGPLRGDESAVRGSFAMLRALGEKCAGLAGRVELSMGMSSDFEWAIEEGSTMVRIGSLLLGPRQA